MIKCIVYLNQLIDKNAKVFLLKKRLETEVKPLETKLADVEKGRADAEKARDEAVILRSLTEQNLANVELEKKYAENKLQSLR